MLEATFATCQARIALKSGTARLLDHLTARPVFHEREQKFYRWLARQRADVVFLEVNGLDAESVAARALKLVRETLPRLSNVS